MERIKKLLEQIILASNINGDEDTEMIATVFLGSIEKGCVDELAAKCEEFTAEKAQEVMFIEECKKMIELN